MFEIAVLLAMTLLLTIPGLFFWRRLRGTVRRSGLIRRAALLTLVIGFLVFLASWQFSKLRTYQLFGELVARVDTTTKLVALTFDDGPTAEYTDSILSILRAACQGNVLSDR